MKPTVKRQLKDIQVQADRLISGDHSSEDLENFGNYSNELKNYLIENISDDFILEKLNEIPNIDDFDTITKTTTGIGFTILAVITFGISVSYLREQKRNTEMMNNVRDIRGKYGSIEFLLKNHN